jgi:hypothetical protein
MIFRHDLRCVLCVSSYSYVAIVSLAKDGSTIPPAALLLAHDDYSCLDRWNIAFGLAVWM